MLSGVAEKRYALLQRMLVEAAVRFMDQCEPSWQNPNAGRAKRVDMSMGLAWASRLLGLGSQFLSSLDLAKMLVLRQNSWRYFDRISLPQRLQHKLF